MIRKRANPEEKSLKTPFPETEDKMRTLANLIIDKIIEDHKNGKLKFQGRTSKVKEEIGL